MKIGLIGCGNMGSALLGGMIRSGFAPEMITAADPSPAARERVLEKYKVHVSAENAEAVRGADLVILAVKPQYLDPVLEGLCGLLAKETTVLSIVAGKSTAYLMERLPEGQKIIRVMPNTPALAGCGMAGFCGNAAAGQADKELAARILGSLGEAEEIPESLMDTVTGLSGSGPAYVFMFIEALADAAVLEGMPRAQAYHFAAQTVKGSAQLVLSTGEHPGKLKDMVCSPAGTTIAGVRALEEKGFRAAVMAAVSAGTERSRQL